MEPIIGDDTMCVAIGTDIEESKLTLIRAFELFPRKKFCILHVHRRDHVIFSISQGFPPSSIAELNQLAKRADDIRDQILEECLKICRSSGKHVEKLHIEMDDVAKGIVELVLQHNIMNLVMGAGANKHLTEKVNINSKKASYVKRYVPPFCNVWFSCRGEFIHRRQISEFGSSSSTYLTDSSRFERLYVEELRRGREAEAEIERLKQLRDEEKLRARDAFLESRAKISSLIQQLEFCKKERDDLRVELKNAQQEEETQCLTEYPYEDIEEATKDYDPSMVIGRGTNGIVYKGLLNHNQVAIKVIYLETSQDLSEFEREVDILRNLCHRNLVKLIGACPDIRALVYELLPNGSLEDRLSCKDDSPPLSWKTRIGIASDLCSVLLYLHSSRPHTVIHGNFAPGNIFLDANFVCKLSETGLGAHPCYAPQCLTKGESLGCVIYSFGSILFKLLTGSLYEPEAFTVEVPCTSLDSSAGYWPYAESLAAQLLRLAVRCCSYDKSCRPDLEMDVLPLLEELRASSTSSSSVFAIPDEIRQPPSCFFCPISQVVDMISPHNDMSKDIMRDPHIAADGHTYEREYMSRWLSDNDTSPKTNLRLANRTLIPNLALRSAIQEWLQHHPSSLHCE